MPKDLKLLIVEDEIKLLARLEVRLNEEGFAITKCGTYSELEEIINGTYLPFDVVILDRLLNGQDSAELVPDLKTAMPEAKILILSAINTPNEKTSLLDQGADDYLSKPFDIDELVARIKALARRNSKELSLGNVVLDLEKRFAKINGQDIFFQNKEFALLKALIKSPGKIYNKKFLYEYVWEMSGDVETNTVETAINKLRRRLEEAGANVRIKSLRFKGYWIEE